METNPNTNTQLALLPQCALVRGIDAPTWNAMKEIFDGASDEKVALAMDYCKARKLDPLKKPVHIVSVWSERRKQMVETIWPAISELRITAHRTGLFAGMDPTRWGPTITQDLGTMKGFVYPEWCEITVYRMVAGQRVAIPGPRCYFLESYATKSRDDYAPNKMWAKRTWSQLEKATESAALRRAFPEECGGQATSDEMAGKTIDDHGAGAIEVQATTVPANGAAEGAAAVDTPKRAAVPKKARGISGATTVVEATPPPQPLAVAEPEKTPEAPAAAVTVEVVDDAPTAAAPAPEAASSQAVAEVLPFNPPEPPPVTSPESTSGPEQGQPADPAPAAPAAPAAEAPAKKRGRPAKTEAAPAAAPAPAPAPAAASTGKPAAEWPKQVRGQIIECVDVPNATNPAKPVKACRLGGGTVMMGGAEMPLTALGRVFFDPAKPEIQQFAAVSDVDLIFTIVEQPSASNPQKVHKVIIAVEEPVQF